MLEFACEDILCLLATISLPLTQKTLPQLSFCPTLMSLTFTPAFPSVGNRSRNTSQFVPLG
jgi:hypothetical protein